MWVYITNNGALLEENGDDAGYFGSSGLINIVNGTVWFGTWANGKPVGTPSSISTPFNRWYHIAWVYNASSTTLSGFIDGQVAVNLNTVRNPAFESGVSNTFYKFCSNGGNFQWNSAGVNINTPAAVMFREFKMSQYAWTQAQIQSQYNSWNFITPADTTSFVINVNTSILT